MTLYELLPSFGFKKSIGRSSVDMEIDFYSYRYKYIGYVYCLCKNKEVVYIGASSSRGRIGRHEKTKDFDEVFYFICNKNLHWEFETNLIRRFKTKYNKCNVAKACHKIQ